ncbi:unnamed protein product [Clonostachys rosea f. rosea IK726]|uniref:Uncharacterized protein n=1 Tax=Clonostachys rosea f. rosea IK726 TaxID=1349383 RepID=A0ACA9TXQ1_BIOOC|nr:unnamed protein product [Clonostachys rosea f. rosea IK726]
MEVWSRVTEEVRSGLGGSGLGTYDLFVTPAWCTTEDHPVSGLADWKDYYCDQFKYRQVDRDGSH